MSIVFTNLKREKFFLTTEISPGSLEDVAEVNLFPEKFRGNRKIFSRTDFDLDAGHRDHAIRGPSQGGCRTEENRSGCEHQSNDDQKCYALILSRVAKATLFLKENRYENVS